MKRYGHHADVKGATSLERVNETRKNMGLPLLVEKDRTCLRCDNTFKSVGPQNRFCEACDRARITNDTTRTGVSNG